MNLIPIDTLGDPRLADYRDIKDRQLRPEFMPRERGKEAVDPAAPLGKFIAEGEVVFRMLARSGYRTLSVLTTPVRLGTIDAEVAMLAADVPVYVIGQREMDALAGFPIHRGLLAIGARREAASVESVLAMVRPGRPLVVLEDLANHDNVGGIFRNAAAFGAAGVLLTARCADPLYRKALRVSVGCALAVPWAVIDPWPEGLGLLEQMGLVVAALTPAASAMALAEFATETASRRVVCVFGSEGHGLAAATIGRAARSVRIPIVSGVDSLNVAAACAVVLDHLCDRGEPLVGP